MNDGELTMSRSRRKANTEAQSNRNSNELTHKPREDAQGERRAGEEIPSSRGWQYLTAFCLSLLLITTSSLALYAFHRVTTLNRDVQRSLTELRAGIQGLDSGISFDSKRQQLLLGIRDVILETNPRASLDQAYDYATYILKASEKYPALDPLLFLAIGIIESGYDTAAISNANARGLYQIWPSTGRMLTRMLDWEFTESVLHDPEKNTELAALYLDILLSAYNDEKLVLAEYNGGPLNAGYLRAGSSRTAGETKSYVAKVTELWDELRLRFEQAPRVRFELMHKDSTREGKRLGERPKVAFKASTKGDNPSRVVESSQ